MSTSHGPRPGAILAMASIFMFAVFLFHYPSVSNGSTPSRVIQMASTRPVEVPLEVFQVQAPLRKGYDGAACQQVIVQHDFAGSYGTPFVGRYNPPQDCNFTNTMFNMSINSRGINYDRLSLLFLSDIEVWRSTTAMPVRTGIFYSFQKDMTIFDTLLRSEQKVIMQLDNIFDSTFTGNFNVTITALYYNDHEATTPADLILPISTQSSFQNRSSVISLPDGNATVLATFPRNAERVVVSIIASGNGNEEFWYSHVPEMNINSEESSNTAAFGNGPFREVHILIDGTLAGVVWPFPTIFTGGISPGLWVPIVGIHTYDLPSFEIDISPWLGILCNGMPHSFELKVVDVYGRTVGSNWWITGSIFIWIDKAGNETSGTALRSFIPASTFSLTPSTLLGNVESIYTHLEVKRILNHTSTITTSSGSRTFTWSQSLTYSNTQSFTTTAHNKTVIQVTHGTSTFSPLLDSSLSDSNLITNTYTYPLTFCQTYITPTNPRTTNSTIIASLDHSLLSSTIPILSHLTSPVVYTTHATLSTRQNGSSVYYWNDTYYQFAGAIDPAMGSKGETEQWYEFIGKRTGSVEVYGRHVRALGGYEPRLVVDETFENGLEELAADKWWGEDL